MSTFVPQSPGHELLDTPSQVRQEVVTFPPPLAKLCVVAGLRAGG